ncbi:MAG: RNA polymerase sigma factor [Acidobacteria bacterium]|nr:RNA polymerase sigma factor [Thermoanaerobaculia bacterium]MDI9631371.1 RNA polymerase sigma factor [Acidobacteriota bacterium]MBP7812681.1 RNA polymerase sigma factor [Thermoanaerobaculia bacterium]MBP8845598.1 RNA polymerase sigma factor [Thermoanaerobaculia bacterium]NLN09989.1 RNA polymerase sigma factor [Acidobacteriota bacterium]
MQAHDDTELMVRIREGDRGAFATLIDRYKDPLVSTLARLTGSRDRAEDLAQETFLRLFHAASRYDERGRLRAFLFQIAVNLARDEERRRRRRSLLLPFVTPAEELDLPAPGPTGEEDLIVRESRRQVARAVAALPLRYRLPLVLHEIEGLSYEETAAACGLPVGTVKSRVARARARLRARLAQYWQGEVRCVTTGS